MTTSIQGDTLIKHYEGLHDGDLSKIGCQPKMDCSGIWTVGWGHALLNPKTGKWLVGKADYPLITKFYPQFLNLTNAQADTLYRKDILPVETKVNYHLKGCVTQGMFDALVSLTFNSGISQTTFDMINEKVSEKEIFDWWTTHHITSMGKVYPGLVYRRKTEAILATTGELRFFN